MPLSLVKCLEVEYISLLPLRRVGIILYHNTYWAKGTDDIAFMGLYATAYGKPKDVTCSGQYTQKILDACGCNCVHAHAKQQLINDEIIYYNEDAMVCNYIVEFG